MAAFWFALGFSGLVAVSAVLPAVRSPRWVNDPATMRGKRLRDYRLFLERRKGFLAIGNVVVPSLAVLWFIFAAVALIRGSLIGLAYLAPAALFALAHWGGNRTRRKLLDALGDRGRVPVTASENKAAPWYRLWGVVFAVGFVGPSAMEYIYDTSFSEDTLSSPTDIVHFVLQLAIILGAVGLAVTYFNSREREPQDGDEPPETS